MYSFGNKRSYGEKAKQQATRERVATIQTVILSEKQLADLTDLIYNHIRSNLCRKQRWKSPDPTPSKEANLPALDPLGRWSTAPPGEKENIQLVHAPSEKVEKEPEKKICSQMIQQEEDIKDPLRQTKSRPKVDIRPINEAYKPYMEELSNKTTCSRNLTHQGVTEKKNWSKIIPNEEVIQLTNRPISNEPERDQRLSIEGFQSNQAESSFKTTCFGNLIPQRHMANWIHVKIPYGLKVIQLLNQKMLDMPYLEAHGIEKLQTHTWRPGEEYNHSGDMSNHPGTSSIILEGSDLRANPFKGGGDGVISISLNFKDLKINHESSNQDHFYQPTRYDGHYGHAKTQLDHAESRDGRISLLSDRSELVRPPEQIQEAILIFDESRHVSAQPYTRDKAQKAQEDTKDELGLLMDEPNKMSVEHGPYWPMKLKDRPPWGPIGGYGRGPSRK